jgi:hypothetical protein
MNKEQIHSASFRARDAAHYLAMAYAYALTSAEREWPLKVALESLTEAADALGFDLVKRPALTAVSELLDEADNAVKVLDRYQDFEDHPHDLQPSPNAAMIAHSELKKAAARVEKLLPQSPEAA